MRSLHFCPGWGAPTVVGVVVSADAAVVGVVASWAARVAAIGVVAIVWSSGTPAPEPEIVVVVSPTAGGAVVVAPGAVVVVSPGTVVVGTGVSHGNCPCTGRKCSSAVREHCSTALSRSFTPGRLH